MIDILKDSIIDTAKLIPFLFITYIIMEYLEHKTSDKNKEHIKKSGKWGPIIGGILGAVPQCGFSVSATNLYIGRVITLGTLIAIYLSTSDEMIPVLLSESVAISVILKILAIKILIGVIIGIIIDLIFKNKFENNNISYICEHDNCHCEDGVIKSSIKHTVNITLFIFVIDIILNTIIAFIGEENIANLILNKPILGPIISGVVGLIPNCAASVIIAKLFVEGVISSGTMIAGLLVSAGVGLLVLFKENDNMKENLKIVSILYLSGTLCGIVLELIGITL